MRGISNAVAAALLVLMAVIVVAFMLPSIRSMTSVNAEVTALLTKGEGAFVGGKYNVPFELTIRNPSDKPLYISKIYSVSLLPDGSTVTQVIYDFQIDPQSSLLTANITMPLVDNPPVVAEESTAGTPVVLQAIFTQGTSNVIQPDKGAKIPFRLVFGSVIPAQVQVKIIAYDSGGNQVTITSNAVTVS